MNKFENVDVLASLQQIMQQNTAAFQNDFDIDKKILTQAAKSKNAEDKVYLWFSRPNGTHCLRERDVFLRGTREHNTFRFYHEQTKERVLAYAVVLSGMESGKVKGSIYELDYAAKADLAQSRPHDLSAGQKQIASVARAIVNDPLLVLADEPCAHLDADNAQHLMDLLGEVSLSNASVIVASHLQLNPSNVVCRPIMLQGGLR